MSTGRGRGPAAVGLLLLVGAAAVSAIGEGPPALPGSARSARPDGRRAALLLLGALGWRARVFDDVPARLPRERALLLVPRVPQRARRAVEDELDAADRALVSGPHSPAYYRRFVDEGGVLAAAAEPELLRWLADDLDLEGLARLAAADEDAGLSRPPRVIAGAEELAVDLRASADLAPRLPPSAEPLVATGDGRVFAARVPVGRGALVLLPRDPFFENGRLGDADHGLLLQRLCERVAPGADVLFDDYAAGAWSPRGPVGRALESRLDLFAWHALALALLALWHVAVPGVFPRGERDDRRLSPMARVAAVAGLLARGRAFGALAHELRLDAFARLERELGAAAGSPPERARALAARRGADAAAWVDALAARRVASAADLAALDRDLRALLPAR